MFSRLFNWLFAMAWWFGTRDERKGRSEEE
ncbi:hypothetical protein OJF2_50680 [Aquisphaera giovannonii]|uniref:Uncharacterized protein n=1 Tax=Aquisphaera giovannonii TaxID=406548 RepID=A0A5B9W8C1_9BACT|nr:hypothetical protein OJF2_50680 [Aquisphaera giovannonii]